MVIAILEHQLPIKITFQGAHMRLEPVTSVPEKIERQAYQAPKLELHGDYTARVGIGGSIDGILPNPGEFWDTGQFWDDLNRPSF